MGRLLQAHLAGARSARRCSSSTAAPRRPSATAWWPASSATTATRRRLFVLSLKAGGTGLNLTRANHVFHFDRWWNPAVENQATDRAFRIGQTRNVQVHKFVCAGTFEEALDELIERKVAPGAGHRRHQRGLDHRAEHGRAARPVRPAPQRRGGPDAVSRRSRRPDWSDWADWDVPAAPPPGRRDQGADAAGPVRRDLVGRALAGRPGAAGRRRAPVARALLRPQRAGHQAGRRRRGRRRPRPGQPPHAVPGDHPLPAR